MVVLLAEAFLWLYTGLMALVYRNYEPNVGVIETLIALVITFLILRAGRVLNRRLDSSMPWEGNLARRFTLQLLGSLILAVFIVFLFKASPLLFPVSTEGMFIRFQDEALRAFVVAVIALFYVLVQMGLYLMHQWKEASTEAERFKKENVEFRFERLQNQVNPHFLFNSLNTLASLIYDDQEAAADFVRQLARVYRYVLETRDKDLTSLEEELKFLNSFLFLVRIRFDQGLEVNIDVPDAYHAYLLPPMSLQLLIENAIKHNIVSPSKPLKISLTVDAENYLNVANVLQLKTAPEPGTRTGLENLRNRYAFLSRKTIDIIKTEAEFRIRLPLLSPELLTEYEPVQ